VCRDRLRPLHAWTVLADTLLAGISGGGRQGQQRHDVSRKDRSAAITTFRKLPFDLLLSLMHAGKWHLPNAIGNSHFGVSAKG
jgi:hypothetical protein